MSNVFCLYESRRKCLKDVDNKQINNDEIFRHMYEVFWNKTCMYIFQARILASIFRLRFEKIGLIIEVVSILGWYMMEISITGLKQVVVKLKWS